MESMHEFVIRSLSASKGHWSQVAEESGVSKRTIEKIARREVKNPRVKVVEKLAHYFHKNPIRLAS